MHGHNRVPSEAYINLNPQLCTNLASFPGSPPARQQQTVHRRRAGGEPGNKASTNSGEV